MKKVMTENFENQNYTSRDGYVLQREFDTETPNGNKMNGRWVLRDTDSNIVDFDAYRNNISERNNLELRDSILI